MNGNAGLENEILICVSMYSLKVTDGGYIHIQWGTTLLLNFIIFTAEQHLAYATYVTQGLLQTVVWVSEQLTDTLEPATGHSFWYSPSLGL